MGGCFAEEKGYSLTSEPFRFICSWVQPFHSIPFLPQGGTCPWEASVHFFRPFYHVDRVVPLGGRKGGLYSHGTTVPLLEWEARLRYWNRPEIGKIERHVQYPKQGKISARKADLMKWSNQFHYLSFISFSSLMSSEFYSLRKESFSFLSLSMSCPLWYLFLYFFSYLMSKSFWVMSCPLLYQYELFYFSEKLWAELWVLFWGVVALVLWAIRSSISLSMSFTSCMSYEF